MLCPPLCYSEVVRREQRPTHDSFIKISLIFVYTSIMHASIIIVLSMFLYIRDYVWETESKYCKTHIHFI